MRSIYWIRFFNECWLLTFVQFISSYHMLYICIVLIWIHVIWIFTKVVITTQQQTVETPSSKFHMLLIFCFQDIFLCILSCFYHLPLTISYKLSCPLFETVQIMLNFRKWLYPMEHFLFPLFVCFEQEIFPPCFSFFKAKSTGWYIPFIGF